ncbi:polypeptide N-acetylgalactosaminyltransferase-like 6 [Mauremys reevesii]|uniref:polypeptide N-acetylgalactosaminyltransferase-like 6 n=1 Tax=Mauremys reevesii TaxID=260615 RepID=UPI00193F03EB|nr:polypeptide N-acetylgalactosaminyltransferase-like 6 [Mauremys reevesii]
MLPFAMKRKQKRFLQMTLLFMVALIFLPNIGLWSLYKDKHLVKSPEPGEQQLFGIDEWTQQSYLVCALHHLCTSDIGVWNQEDLQKINIQSGLNFASS